MLVEQVVPCNTSAVALCRESVSSRRLGLVSTVRGPGCHIGFPPSEPGCLAPAVVPLALDDGVDLVAIGPIQVVRVPEDPPTRVALETLHVEDRGADAVVEVLRGERVGRYGGHFLLVRGAVESQLVECGDDGVAAQATRGELLSEFLGDIGGYEGDGLVVDVSHP